MKLSIITINRNNCEGLKRTINSVLFQSFKDFEWIVIDGASNDGSRELLELHKSSFAYYCSEPDKGIYNAINKGIIRARGNYLQFLNSGDWFYSGDTLENVFSKIDNDENKADIYYGDMVQVNEGNKKNPITYPDELGFFFFPYNNICHQATFYRRELFEDNPYDESFSIVSDWAMNFNLLFKGCTFKHLNQYIAYYDNQGLSSVSDDKHHIERTAAFEKYVPQQIKIDLRRYEENYHFSRHRKSTRWIMDNAISLCKRIDHRLTQKEKRRKK